MSLRLGHTLAQTLEFEIEGVQSDGDRFRFQFSTFEDATASMNALEDDDTIQSAKLFKGGDLLDEFEKDSGLGLLPWLFVGGVVAFAAWRFWQNKESSE